MPIQESELRERLLGDDDDDLDAALALFEPTPKPTPFMLRWYPRADLQLEVGQPDADGAFMAGVRERCMGWANDAQRLWRARQFHRRREANPELPVVVCEGDSWVAHPIIDDITDHLLDDERYPVHALGVGAAADLLRKIDASRDHEQAVEQYGAAALLLSGGGNDLMLAFHAFLRPWRPGAAPERLLTPVVDACMHALMVTLKTLLVRTRKRMPALPIVVHGYDYLRVRDHDQGGALGFFFDRAGIRSPAERRAVLGAVVDRYNVHVKGVVDCVPGVSYVDLRGLVTRDDEWQDEIHPTGDGFGRLTERIAEVVLTRIAEAG